MNDAETALPVTVIAGYLGAGKTTMVNHLLRHADGLRLAVLVNEFGDLPIDRDLIEAEDDTLISIAGGCVCCSYGNDLTAAMMTLSTLTPPPEHILIEASGVAVPGAIAASLSLLSGFAADCIVTLADAERVRQTAGDKYMGDTAQRQLADADIIILNKADLVDPATLSATQDWLRTQNPAARIVQTTDGVVLPALVLDSFIGRTHSAGPHHDISSLEVHILHPKGPIDVLELTQALTRDHPGVIRGKGFVTGTDGGRVLVQGVGPHWKTTPATGAGQDALVIIGHGDALDLAGLKRLTNAD